MTPLVSHVGAASRVLPALLSIQPPAKKVKMMALSERLCSGLPGFWLWLGLVLAVVAIRRENQWRENSFISASPSFSDIMAFNKFVFSSNKI